MGEAEAEAPKEPVGGAPPDRLAAAVREARDDAAPFGLAAAGTLVVLAVVSRHAHWGLLGYGLWWMWLVVAVPYVCLSATLVVGLGRLVRHDRRREIVIALLVLVWGCNVLAVVVLVVSLVARAGVHMTGRQLLFSGGVAWFTDAVAFGLAYWELDCGGPVARALETAPRKPDFQFPQDENPQLAREGWAPRLWDYFYVSLTNSIAFSPTDAMPLTRPAKTFDGGRVDTVCNHDSSGRRTRRKHLVVGVQIAGDPRLPRPAGPRTPQRLPQSDPRCRNRSRRNHTGRNPPSPCRLLEREGGRQSMIRDLWRGLRPSPATVGRHQ